jgi:hypothetical protein
MSSQDIIHSYTLLDELFEIESFLIVPSCNYKVFILIIFFISLTPMGV